MVKFEYKIVEDTLTEKALNELGTDGWEAILLLETAHRGVYRTVFKRKVTSSFVGGV